MIVTAINEIKNYIEKELKADDYMMTQRFSNGEEELERQVIPAVTTGSIPHQNFNLYGADDVFFQAPYILVGIEGVDHDFEKLVISVLIQVCSCSSTYYEKNIPDNRAFEDTLILLEWIKKKIIEQWNFSGLTVDGSFKIGSYNTKEMTYPYSFGYLNFSIEGKEIELNRNNLYH